MCLCDLRSIFNKQTGTTKIITGFYLPAAVCFSYCCCCFCYCDCFFIVLLLLLFFDYIFCLSRFLCLLLQFVLLLLNVFFYNRLFRFVAYSALFVSFTHTHNAVETDRAQSKNGGTSLIFSLLFFYFSLSDVSAQSMRSRAPCVVEGFLLMQVRTLLQMRFDGGNPSAFMPQQPQKFSSFLLFVVFFVSTISQSSVSYRGGFSEHDIHNLIVGDARLISSTISQFLMHIARERAGVCQREQSVVRASTHTHTYRQCV